MRATVRAEPAKPGLVAMVVVLLACVPGGTGWLRLVRGGGAVLRAGWRRTGRSLGGATAGSLAGCGQPEPLEQQGVDGDQEAGAGHRQRRDLWPQDETEGRLENAGRNRQGDGVVADGPAEVLPHLAQRALADA